MSQFKRDGKWVAKFTKDGEQHWVPGGPWPTKIQARRAEEGHRAKLEQEPASTETCESWAARWVVEFQRPGPATQRQYENAAARFAREWGDKPLVEVTRLDARKWALGVPRSISRVIGTMFADAMKYGLTNENPFHQMGITMGEKKREIEAPTMDEYGRILEACGMLGGYGPEMRRMIQFAAWTGVRQGELFALKWEDIGDETIQVRRSRKLDGSIGLPKNGRAREIIFTPPARVLEDQPRRAGSEFVFHSPQGRPLLKGTHAWSWQKVKAGAGLPNIRWHDWRHFCATQLLEMGIDHFAVSIQLGHTDGGILVQNRYGHPSHDRARARLLAAFEIGSSIGSEQTTTREAGQN
jgi:integrase